MRSRYQPSTGLLLQGAHPRRPAERGVVRGVEAEAPHHLHRLVHPPAGRPAPVRARACRRPSFRAAVGKNWIELPSDTQSKLSTSVSRRAEPVPPAQRRPTPASPAPRCRRTPGRRFRPQSSGGRVRAASSRVTTPEVLSLAVCRLARPKNTHHTQNTAHQPAGQCTGPEAPPRSPAALKSHGSTDGDRGRSANASSPTTSTSW